MTCSECGRQNPAAAIFCGDCGARLAATGAPAGPTVAMPTQQPTPEPEVQAPAAESNPQAGDPGLTQVAGQSGPPSPQQAYAQQGYPQQGYVPDGQGYPQQYLPAWQEPQPQQRGGSRLLAAILSGLAVLAIAGAAIWFFALRPHDTDEAASPSEVVVTVTATGTEASATPESTDDPTADASTAPTEAATTTTAETFPDVISHGGQECARYGTGPYAAVGTDNPSTTCAFAENVRNAYVAAGINGGAGTVMAHSPQMQKDYVMSCSGSQPVLCTGGVAARVLIYGGTLR